MAMPPEGCQSNLQARYLDAKQLGFQECVSAAVPEGRNKFYGMKGSNFRHGEIGRQNEIARRSDVRRHRVRLRGGRHFYWTARRAAAAKRLRPIWFRRSVAAGTVRAIRHVRHDVRLILFG